MTPEEIVAQLVERKQKFRNALEKLEERKQSNKAGIAKLNKLLDRLDALDEQSTKSTGRPPTWKGALGYETVLIVGAMQRQGLSIADALRSLRKDPPWDHYSEEQLSTRYQEARKYWEPLIEELADIERAIAQDPLDNSPSPDVRRLVREG